MCKSYSKDCFCLKNKSSGEEMIIRKDDMEGTKVKRKSKRKSPGKFGDQQDF